MANQSADRAVDDLTDEGYTVLPYLNGNSASVVADLLINSNADVVVLVGHGSIDADENSIKASSCKPGTSTRASAARRASNRGRRFRGSDR